jgi:hypothetical protein
MAPHCVLNRIELGELGKMFGKRKVSFQLIQQRPCGLIERSLQQLLIHWTLAYLSQRQVLIGLCWIDR